MHPKPHPKRKITSGVSNSIMEKISYGLGWTTPDKMTLEINPFPSMLNIQAKLTLRDKGAYLILDVRSRTPLSFQSNLYLHIALNNNKIYKHDICKVLESNITCYIPIHNQSNYIHA